MVYYIYHICCWGLHGHCAKLSLFFKHIYGSGSIENPNRKWNTHVGGPRCFSSNGLRCQRIRLIVWNFLLVWGMLAKCSVRMANQWPALTKATLIKLWIWLGQLVLCQTPNAMPMLPFKFLSSRYIPISLTKTGTVARALCRTWGEFLEPNTYIMERNRIRKPISFLYEFLSPASLWQFILFWAFLFRVGLIHFKT